MIVANGGRCGGRIGRCRRIGRILQQQLLDLEDVDVLVEAGTGIVTVVYSRAVAVVASVGGGRGTHAQASKAVQIVASTTNMMMMMMMMIMVLSNLMILLLLLLMIEMRMVIWRRRY